MAAGGSRARFRKVAFFVSIAGLPPNIKSSPHEQQQQTSATTTPPTTTTSRINTHTAPETTTNKHHTNTTHNNQHTTTNKLRTTHNRHQTAPPPTTINTTTTTTNPPTPTCSVTHVGTRIAAVAAVTATAWRQRRCVASSLIFQRYGKSFSTPRLERAAHICARSWRTQE